MAGRTTHTGARDDLAGRLRRPSWRDPRLLTGILLILLSVAAVVTVLRVTHTASPYYVAKHDIVVGDQVTAADFEVREANLGDTGQAYLDGDQPLSSGTVATQAIRTGQMVPRTSIGTKDKLDRKPMSLTVPQDLVGGLEQGQTVDVWVSQASGNSGKYADPVLRVSRAEVARIVREDDALGGSDQATVQVLVDESELPGLIKAVASESKITLVPSYGTGSR